MLIFWSTNFKHCEITALNGHWNYNGWQRESCYEQNPSSLYTVIYKKFSLKKHLISDGINIALYCTVNKWLVL
jgi:hypothetical protein